LRQVGTSRHLHATRFVATTPGMIFTILN